MGLLAGMIAIDLRTSPCNAVLATAFLDLDDAAVVVVIAPTRGQDGTNADEQGTPREHRSHVTASRMSQNGSHGGADSRSRL